jgi:hypothetical protein
MTPLESWFALVATFGILLGAIYLADYLFALRGRRRHRAHRMARRLSTYAGPPVQDCRTCDIYAEAGAVHLARHLRQHHGAI